MTHRLLIDGNSIAHASHNTAKLTSSVKGGIVIETQAIYGFLRTLRNLLSDRPDTKPHVLWDGEARFRYLMYPDYKSNRVSDRPEDLARRKSFQIQKPYIHSVLRHLGVRQTWHYDLEADDIAAILTNQLTTSGEGVTLITSDKDWLQLIGPGVDWYDPVRKNRINATNLFSKTGYKTAKEFLEGKILQGDSSDKITGVGGIGEKGAPLFIAKYGSIAKFLRGVANGTIKPENKAQQRLASPEGMALVRRNLALMKLDPYRKVDEFRWEHFEGPFDREAFLSILIELEFSSLLIDLDGYVQPFNRMPVGHMAIGYSRI